MDNHEYQNKNYFQKFVIIICMIIICIGIVIGYKQPQSQNTTKKHEDWVRLSGNNQAIKSGEQKSISWYQLIWKHTELSKKSREWNTVNIPSKTNSTKVQSPKLMWKIVYVKWFPEDSIATQIATYSYQISSGDLDFLATMKAENGGYNMYQQSNVYKNGKREESYGLCQMMRKFHPEVNTKIFWESWKYQVETCYKKYKWGTMFYGYYVRDRYKNDFTIKSLSDNNK